MPTQFPQQILYLNFGLCLINVGLVNVYLGIE